MLAFEVLLPNPDFQPALRGSHVLPPDIPEVLLRPRMVFAVVLECNPPLWVARIRPKDSNSTPVEQHVVQNRLRQSGTNEQQAHLGLGCRIRSHSNQVKCLARTANPLIPGCRLMMSRNSSMLQIASLGRGNADPWEQTR